MSNQKSQYLLLGLIGTCLQFAHAARHAQDEEDRWPAFRAAPGSVVTGARLKAAQAPVWLPRDAVSGGMRVNPIPTGSAEAATRGHFGPVLAWPSVPIHWVLLADGRLLTFGASTAGVQGGERDYSLWNPTRGQGLDAFEVLPNTTAVNTFCASQWLLPDSGEVLLAGGSLRLPEGHLGIDATTVFSPRTKAMTAQAPMGLRRWYATTVGTAEGEVVVLGGRSDPPMLDSTLVTAGTPEIYNPATRTWRMLSGATDDYAYGARGGSWNYPRAWLAPSGRIFIASRSRRLFELSTLGEGHATLLPTLLPEQGPHLGAAMYAPGKVLVIGLARSVSLIDLNGPTPTVTAGMPMSRHRRYGNLTILADGRLLANGGVDADDLTLTGAHLESELWDPATGQWVTGASAALPRLYHSNAILLPDATVLTGGGGLPGPLTNANVEVYYPPYLYRRDGSGQPAPRPVIDTRPIASSWGQDLWLKSHSGKPITRVTLVASGMATHSFNNSQRFMSLSFQTSPGVLKVHLPEQVNIAPSANYLLFAFDSDGVPSMGKFVRLGS